MPAQPTASASAQAVETKVDPKPEALHASEKSRLEIPDHTNRSPVADQRILPHNNQSDNISARKENGIENKPRKVTFGAVEDLPEVSLPAPTTEHEDDTDEEDEDYTLSEDENLDENENDDENEEEMPPEQFASAIAEVSTLLKGRLKSFLDSGTLGSKPLHAAAASNDVSKLRQLLKSDSEYHDKINDVDVFQYNALHVAAERGCVEACKLLLELGIDKNATTRMHQSTALHYAAFEGHDDVISVLLEGSVDVDAVTDDSRTALYQASLRGHTECVDLLLRNGANREIKAQEGKTAAQVATKEEIKLMFQQPAPKKARTGS
ncbi:unnamed protein product [Agarophyton chilense]